MTQCIRIVYPSGDKTKLTTVITESYEEDDWCLASRQIFNLDAAEHAEAYAEELAAKHGLQYVSKSKHKVLD